MQNQRGAAAYRRTEAETRSPMELVVMLYDGALRFMHEATAAIERGDVRARAEATRRALNITTELQTTLNVQDGGEIAVELDRLYTYINTRMLDVTRGDAAAAAEVAKLLTTLRDGWVQAAQAQAASR